MPLYKLKDYYPNYRETLGDSEMAEIDNYSVYTEGDDRIGSAKDLLVDQSGRFRYVVVDTGPWIFGKNVLLPIGLAHFDYNQHRIYVNGLSKDQVENLPEYRDNTVVDEQYENRVREQYRPLGNRRSTRQFMNQTYQTDQTGQPGRDMQTAERTAYDANYDREPHLYGMSEQDNHGPLRLYEERLVTHRNHVKTGEVAVGKKVKTETAEASVPVEKERVIIERRDATGRTAVPGEQHRFEDGEVARMDVYEDEVNVEKQAFVREEVTIRKEVDRDTVKAKDTVRREELDIDTKGNPRVDR